MNIGDGIDQLEKTIKSMMIGADILEANYEENRHILNSLRSEIQILLDQLLGYSSDCKEEESPEEILAQIAVLDRFTSDIQREILDC